jgi:gamma-glutamyl hercynylcysteine S-oxide hydrolase
MCRHVAWLGEPRSLSSLMLEPPHGLLVQSYAPRAQRHGRINADGWGVGFYAADQFARPARWRSTRPLWSDASFSSVAPAISSSCLLGAVRSASAGMPIEESATAPFASGPWLLSHNGVLDRSALPEDIAITDAESVCDSAMLAAYTFARGPAQLAAIVAEIGSRDAAARLNVLVTDGTQIIATTWGDTLSVLRDRTGVVVASEPYDNDPRWCAIPDRHVVEVSDQAVTVTPLEIL